MMFILAVLSFLLFVLGTVSLFGKWSDKLTTYSQEVITKASSKEVKEDADGEAVAAMLIGCAGLVLYAIFAFFSWFIELMVIIAALVSNTGDQSLGLLALIFMVGGFALSHLRSRRITEEKKRVEEGGGTFVLPLSPMWLKLVNYVPDLYMAYLFLVAIKVL